MESNLTLKKISLRIKNQNGIVAFLIVMALSTSAEAQDPTPRLSWDFSKIDNRNAIELQSGIADTLEGYFKTASGIRGSGLRLDGFTCCLKHSDRNLPAPGKEFTIEAWVALGNYSWNWCPLLTTESSETKGYRLMIGPHGEVSLQTAIGEQWISVRLRG